MPSIDEALRVSLLQSRGDNRELFEEIKEKLSPKSRERLFRVLQEKEQEAASEMRKRKSGQFWR
jgi:predicted Mrr-cat superfamily restriction endonuclease